MIYQREAGIFRNKKRTTELVNDSVNIQDSISCSIVNLLKCSLFLNCVYFSFLRDFMYLVLERGEGKDKERKRNISVWLPLMHPLLGTWPATQARALTENQTGDPLLCSVLSIHWAMPARKLCLFFFMDLQYLTLPLSFRKSCMAQVTTTRLMGRIRPPPCYIRPGTLLLPGGSAEPSLNCSGAVTCTQS